MSLIDEALKRARMEAAQKAAEGEDLPYPTIPRHLGPRRRSGWLVPLVVALAVIAGVAAGLLLASRGGSAGEQLAERGLEAGSPSTVSPPAPVAAAATSLADGSDPGENTAAAPTEPEPAGKAPTSPAQSLPSGQGPTSPARSLPTPDRPEAAPAMVQPAATNRPSPAPPPSSSPTADPEPPSAPSAATVTDPESGVLLVLPQRPGQTEAEPVAGPASDTSDESYAQQYPLPSGGAIELGGIAWSETGPFALINGRVVGPGSVIEGYTLERIRPGHVVLNGDGRRIHLSLQ